VRCDDLADEEAGAWAVDTAGLVEDCGHVGELFEVLAVDVLFGFNYFIHLVDEIFLGLWVPGEVNHRHCQ
jgi:hypothetical protein